MSTVPPAPALSVSATVASQQPLARPVVGFEAPEQKLQALPPVAAGAETIRSQERPGGTGDGRQGGQQPQPPAEAGDPKPGSGNFVLPAPTTSQPRFRPVLTSASPDATAAVTNKRRAQDLQAALDIAPSPGQLLNDTI